MIWTKYTMLMNGLSRISFPCEVSYTAPVKKTERWTSRQAQKKLDQSGVIGVRSSSQFIADFSCYKSFSELMRNPASGKYHLTASSKAIAHKEMINIGLVGPSVLGLRTSPAPPPSLPTDLHFLCPMLFLKDIL